MNKYPSFLLTMSALLITSFLHSSLVTDGTPNQLFGTNGTVIVATNASSILEDPIILGDNSIIAVGKYNIGVGTTRQLLVKFKQDGSLDTSFGSNGLVINTDFFVSNILLLTKGTSHCVVQSDGKIVTIDSSGTGDIVFARYLPNGTIDTTFGENSGHTIVNLSGTDNSTGIAIAQDDSIFAVGNGNNGTIGYIIKLTPSGLPDTSFGTNGKVNPQFSGINVSFRDLELAHDGKIVVGGTTQAIQRFVIARFNPNGTFDTTFGQLPGYTITPIGSVTVFTSGIAINADDTIVQYGFESVAGPESYYVIKYSSNGRRDASFGSQGISKFLTNITTVGLSTAMTLANDGKILVTGVGFAVIDEPFIARLLVNGTLDNSFGENGIIHGIFATQTEQTIVGIVTDMNNNIITVGSVSSGANRRATCSSNRVDSLQNGSLYNALWQRYHTKAVRVS